jgi:hypothetical protein
MSEGGENFQMIHMNSFCKEPVIIQWVSRIGYKLNSQGVGVQFPAEAREFLLSTASRPALGPA